MRLNSRAPKCETERRLAEAARDRVIALLANHQRDVTLLDVRNGKFAGRVVANVQTPEGDIGAALIAENVARPARTRLDWCAPLSSNSQSEAISVRRVAG